MIEISELTAGYGSKTIISRFSFSSADHPGPLVLAGPNGSGKSTLLKAILGEISYSGKIQKLNPDQGIGWLPQNYHVGLRMPVVDFIRLGGTKGGKWFPSFVPDVESLAEKAINQLEIGHLARKFTDELSGGEWQLVCLAQLLIQPTQIWLLDEPTASLDVYYKSFIFNFLWEMGTQGKTIILATHDIPFLPTQNGWLLQFPQPSHPISISAESLDLITKQLSSKQAIH